MRKEFYTGHLFDVYRYFGAHKEGENFIFRVFAHFFDVVLFFYVILFFLHLSLFKFLTEN